MGYLLLLPVLAFSLLPNSATSIRDAPQSSCSSATQDNVVRHQNSSGDLQFILHHPRSPCSPVPFPSSLSFSDLLLHDDARARSLAARLTNPRHPQRRPPPPSSPFLDDHTATVYSGSSIGAGNYVIQVGLGSPAQSLAVVIDTGSSLPWIQCFPCDYCHSQVGSLFDPFSSDTYRTLSCPSPACTDLTSATLNSPACSLLSDVCIYEASYGDSSYSIGYLSTDTLSLGSSGGGATVQDFVYGCGVDNQGIFGQSDGLFGLARNNVSLFFQLAPKFGYSFSYCLPTIAGTGYLSFGPYNPSEYSYTPIVPSSLDESLYFVKLIGINVEGKGLALPDSAYASLPTIMDSGTVITRLPSEVYSGLSSAVAAALKGYSQAPAYSILVTCFTGSVEGLPVPAVDLVFEDGATLSLPPDNVMIDVGNEKACLSFAATKSVTIIGNQQQQTFRLVYDVSRSRIGFGGIGCA